MPYARSAPTADAAHYEQDRALQWQREKQIRKDAARRRKLRAQSNEKRQAAETERAQNEYAERKHKKLEYVKYLRSQLRRRQKPKRTPREPTQYEVEERMIMMPQRRVKVYTFDSPRERVRFRLVPMAEWQSFAAGMRAIDAQGQPTRRPRPVRVLAEEE